VAKIYEKVFPVFPGDQQNLIAYGVELKSQPGIVLQVGFALLSFLSAFLDANRADVNLQL